VLKAWSVGGLADGFVAWPAPFQEVYARIGRSLGGFVALFDAAGS